MKRSRSVLSLILFLACFTAKNALAQSTIKNSFVIHSTGLSQNDLDFYKKSIEAADFEQFRLKTQTVILKFKNGFTLELLPAKDLVVKKGMTSLDMNKYSDFKGTSDYKYPLFEILSTGWVTAAVETNNKH